MTKEIDKFVMPKGNKERISLTTLSVRTSSFEVFKSMQNKSGATVSELFDAMVNFCSERFEVEKK